MNAPIAAITFDLDDTLWAVAPVIRRAEAQVRRWLASNYPMLGAAYVPENLMRIRAEVSNQYPDRKHDLSFLRRAVYRQLAQEGNVESQFSDEAFKVFDHWRNQVDFYSDALPAIERLAECVPLIAVTNGNADVERVGLGRYFSGAINASKAGAAKPAPEIFQQAIAHAGQPAQRILHVGDDPEADVAGAQGVGMPVAWLNRKLQSWDPRAKLPTLEVADLTELADYLEQQDFRL